MWSCALPSPPEPRPWLLDRVRRIWARATADRRRAGPVIAAALRADRALGSRDRRAAADMLWGMIRHERALARLAPDPVDAWLRLAREGVPDLDDPPDAYAIAVSLPEALAGEWWARLGPERAIRLARVIAGRAPVYLRVLREPVELPVAHRRVGERTIRLEEGVDVHTLAAFREGRVEVQDLHSQAIVDRVFPGPGARVLDLCAGAGGKSLALAALGARVRAWDARPGALAALRERAARARLAVEVGPPEGRYDLVLVDAPCSGTGVLRRHPENRWKLEAPTATQRALLTRALGLGDRVVYATCALARAENEDLVRAVGEGVDEHTWWPEAGGGDGFYVAEVRPRTAQPQSL